MAHNVAQGRQAPSGAGRQCDLPPSPNSGSSGIESSGVPPLASSALPVDRINACSKTPSKVAQQIQQSVGAYDIAVAVVLSTSPIKTLSCGPSPVDIRINADFIILAPVPPMPSRTFTMAMLASLAAEHSGARIRNLGARRNEHGRAEPITDYHQQSGQTDNGYWN